MSSCDLAGCYEKRLEESPAHSEHVFVKSNAVSTVGSLCCLLPSNCHCVLHPINFLSSPCSSVLVHSGCCEKSTTDLEAQGQKSVPHSSLGRYLRELQCGQNGRPLSCLPVTDVLLCPHRVKRARTFSKGPNSICGGRAWFGFQRTSHNNIP